MTAVRFCLLTPALLAALTAAGAAYAVDTRPPPRVVTIPHVNPVTKDQLIAAGATCAGTECDFHGVNWDCSNPQDCHVVKNL